MPLGIDSHAALRPRDPGNPKSLHRGRPAQPDALQHLDPQRPARPPRSATPALASLQAAAHPAAVDYLYYLRKPNSQQHFFTASEQEFCAKTVEYGYHPC